MKPHVIERLRDAAEDHRVGHRRHAARIHTRERVVVGHVKAVEDQRVFIATSPHVTGHDVVVPLDAVEHVE